jgi:hypothetical protein
MRTHNNKYRWSLSRIKYAEANKQKQRKIHGREFIKIAKETEYVKTESQANEEVKSEVKFSNQVKANRPSNS